MCILFVANRVHPSWPLLIAANRDEFFTRPSKGVHMWEDHPGILAGRDLRAGGSWLGINGEGRFAAVTNVRAPQLRQAGARSRGDLVSRWLEGADSGSAFSEFLAESHREFNPFNLLYGDISGLSLYSSIAPGDTSVGEGFWSVSNGLPTDSWPKMSRGVNLLSGYVGEMEAPDTDRLASLMKDNARVDWSQLEDSGIPVDYEEALSSIFVDAIEIKGEIYGTRTTSILAWDGEAINFTEFDYGETGELRDRREYRMSILQPG
jgi:uncharacterized protein with NRDE domain